jgi:CBS domain-containing protein
MDWIAFGGAYEGTADLVGRYVTEVATCAPEDTVRDAAQRAEGGVVAVVDGERVVIGVLDRENLATPDDRPAGDVVSLGPRTVRPTEERAALNKRMASKHVDSLLVTDSLGRLLGFYAR